MQGRCPWCGTDPLYVAYHDAEWGVPLHDPRALWEALTLECFQAGLSWITVLRKREAFRARLDGFDPARIARWGEAEIAAALGDPGIIRHRGKIEAAVTGARAYLALEARGGFAPFVWRHAEGARPSGPPATIADVPARTAASEALAKALKAAGFKFCGPTTVYAFMQAAGLVNDHLASCPRRGAVALLA
jgi:DNA-3-methyladenine glycosylase I